MRHIFCAFFCILLTTYFDSKFALADMKSSNNQSTNFKSSKFDRSNINHLQKSYLTQDDYQGEAAQVRLDNFISVSNSNPQQNQDLFIAIESIRQFEFNAIKSEWNLGSRYSDLEGFQFWIKELKTEYVKNLPSLDTKVGFKLGRFYQTDLKIDSIWGLGVVESQFRGDPLTPLHQGLTGLSVWSDLGGVEFSLFASPLSLPDTGVAYNIQDGQLVSNSPWFTQAPTSVNYQGQDVNLSYNLDISNRLDLLVNPSILAGLKTKVYGLGFAVHGGLLPSNQFFLEVDPKARVNPQGEAFVEANVVPELLSKTVLAVKLDKQFKSTSLWAEYFSESHQLSNNSSNPDLYQSEVFDSTFIALGLDSKIRFKAMDLDYGFSYLRNPSRTKLNSFNEFQFGNYIYNNAFETRLALKFYPSRFTASFNFKYDLDESAFLASPRFTYRTQDNLQVYSQYDLIGRASDDNVQGFLAQQAANDRFTVGINYVF